MSARAWKLAAAFLLAVAIGVQLLEVSGRWDRTFQDANDEAAIVAIVLCVGLALTTAATVLPRLTVTRRRTRPPTVRFATSRRRAMVPLPDGLASTPPLPVRI